MFYLFVSSQTQSLGFDLQYNNLILSIIMRRLLTSKFSKALFPAFRFSNAKQSETVIFANSFLNSSNVNFLQNQYAMWANDPSSVSLTFSKFFTTFSGEGPKSDALFNRDNLSTVDQALRIKLLLDAYRTSGHQFADTDPLQLKPMKNGSQDRSIIDYKSFGFTEQDLDKNLNVNDIGSGIGVSEKTGWTLRKLIAYLDKVYCSKVGFEYMHLNSRNQRIFLREKIQNLERFTPSKQEKLVTWKRLCHDQCFNEFLVKKFANYKRFGIQGLNSIVGGLSSLVDQASQHGTEYIALGMAHRGRLNVIHCVLGLPAENVYDLFLDNKSYGADERGDVKYHIGYQHQKILSNGKTMKLSLLSNPSHLEAVDPLIYGRVRAIQDIMGDKNRQKSIGVIIHGDAAVAGQGIVYESLQMQDLNDYSTGGIIHIVMNNQIGFTTEQRQGRSTFYCTEIGKVVNAPIFHVNADEPDLVDKVFKIAVEYRQIFNKDIFIDVIGYRKFGHNQQDQPMFTQPLMYQRIKQMPSVFVKYTEKLIKEGILTEQQVIKNKKEHSDANDFAYKIASEKGGQKYFKLPEWQNIKTSSLWGNKTGVSKNQLQNLIKSVTTWPQDFNVHATIKRLFDERIKNYNAQQGLDMATMQSLAFASLLREGFDVRLSGQDVQRGTFSHRHAVLSDQKIDRQKFVFLKSINPKATVCNSHLSQFAVMGFQYGYTITNPNCLVIWEAQFGDFSNVAQIMIDNYVVSGEGKWNIQSGLVLSLPHGLDGQGPEHSSARLQRFLQASNDRTDAQNNSMPLEDRIRTTNIQVAYCTNSANYFHILRRQLRRGFRKPLILMISKKLLKLKAATSKLSDIEQGTQFRAVIEEPVTVSNQKVRKLIFCSGQFFYDIRNTKDEKKINDLAIVRLEQISPFPQDEVRNILAKYPNAEVIWAQQQHENQGAWGFVRPRLKILSKGGVNYYGRNSLAASACGTLKHHKMQQEIVLNRLFA